MVREQVFMKSLMIAIGRRPDMRIHRQNTGAVRTIDGGYFNAGPPKGAADVSGIIRPEGWRIEIETKAEKTTETEAQDGWRDMIRAHGGVYVRIRFDERLTVDQNVELAVRLIDEAIAERRSRACP